MIKVAPSILSADLANLAQDVSLISKYADYVHVDVMDGHFVPNLTFGPKFIEAIKPYCTVPIDVHLMTYNIERNIKDFALAGADIITIHYESYPHVERALNQIKNLGKKAGIALVPGTPENTLDYLIDLVDLVLIMTVNPGFSGQGFIPSQLTKIANTKQKILATGKPIELQVDGGINHITAKEVIKAGADILVAGSYLFEQNRSNFQQAIKLLKDAY